jgi:uncharacterized membrane protein YkgB
MRRTLEGHVSDLHDACSDNVDDDDENDGVGTPCKSDGGKENLKLVHFKKMHTESREERLLEGSAAALVGSVGGLFHPPEPHCHSFTRPGDDPNAVLIHPGGERTRWSDLFLDIVFVAAIGKLGTSLQDGHTDLPDFFCVFLNTFNVWQAIVAYSGRFDTADLFHQATFCFLMLAILVNGVDDRSVTHMLVCTESALFVNWGRVWLLQSISGHPSNLRLYSMSQCIGIAICIAGLVVPAQAFAENDARLLNQLLWVHYVAMTFVIFGPPMIAEICFGIRDADGPDVQLDIPRVASRFDKMAMISLGMAIVGILPSEVVVAVANVASAPGESGRGESNGASPIASGEDEGAEYAVEVLRDPILIVGLFTCCAAIKILRFDIERTDMKFHALHDSIRGFVWISTLPFLCLFLLLMASGAVLVVRTQNSAYAHDSQQFADLLDKSSRFLCWGMAGTLTALSVSSLCHHWHLVREPWESSLGLKTISQTRVNRMQRRTQVVQLVHIAVKVGTIAMMAATPSIFGDLSSVLPDMTDMLHAVGVPQDNVPEDAQTDSTGQVPTTATADSDVEREDEQLMVYHCKLLCWLMLLVFITMIATWYVTWTRQHFEEICRAEQRDHARKRRRWRDAATKTLRRKKVDDALMAAHEEGYALFAEGHHSLVAENPKLRKAHV